MILINFLENTKSEEIEYVCDIIVAGNESLQGQSLID